MSHYEQYILRVTAGPSYDTATHKEMLVNNEKPMVISNEHVDAKVTVRVKDYRGLPPNSPSTSPYFATTPHTSDRYSISFSFAPKAGISGHHLVFGNDFENPIRDRLPPLFDKAFSIVKWWIDPGLDGDVYGDKPYLYGALLSSINVLRIGSKPAAAANEPEDKAGEAAVFTEGADGDGEEVRTELGVPSDARQRQKHFLAEEKRKAFEFEQGREYKCDFFNPYLDFNEFALKLGYGLPPISIMGHWDGQPLRTHSLRYVLKNRDTDTALFVVIFQLVPTDKAKKEDGVLDAEKQFEEAHGGKGKGEENKEVGVGGDDDELD
ncbi:DUF1769-domain-containing protein [Melanomma pulvis-pyrius CBS 109.77]|uniref:DUF1769-domain-containing protein n=1 Tax=Melanomma pulvis-pyrius CBS 109.77 TaxID=1314802 RepID=A0A6A6XFS7_9PLEO|nr:DUF1769-domain-containing protein [Melanomma pulvis-pyrius CBS 109.77]